VFEGALQRYREVTECYLMSGDADYLIRVVLGGARCLQRLIIDQLSKIPGAGNIRSRFVHKQVKYKIALPLPEAPTRESQLWTR
jgi:Lrp/AsnC family leucine-responsive transcriptional regulator